MRSDKVVDLTPVEAVSLDLHLWQAWEEGTRGVWAEDMVEEIVICLAAIEAAWTQGEFGRLRAVLATLKVLTGQTGLDDLTRIATQLETLIAAQDGVAVAAVTARLVRVGEAALAALLEISYRQL